MSYPNFDGLSWNNPAYDMEAEQSVLGLLLLGDKPAMETAKTTLSGSDFYLEQHQQVFEAAIALADRGTEVDIITVQEELSRRGISEWAGDIAFLVSLFDTLPVPGHMADYAQVVYLCARWRSH